MGAGARSRLPRAPRPLRGPAGAGVLVLTAVLVAVHAAPAPAAPVPPAEDPPSVVVVVDTSARAAEPAADGRPRAAVAADALAATVAALPDEARVGVRLAGGPAGTAPTWDGGLLPPDAAGPPASGPAGGCAASAALVPVAPVGAWRGTVPDLPAPSGVSATAAALRLAVDDLPATGGATVVLVAGATGGCAPGQTCETAREIDAAGLGVRVDVVALAADPADAAALADLQCVADATGGVVVGAGEAAGAASALTRAVLRGASPLAGPTLEVLPGVPAPEAALPDQSVLPVGPDAWQDVLRPGQSRRLSIEVGAGEVLLASALATAPVELADRVLLRLAVGTPEGPAPADDAAVLLGGRPETLRARTRLPESAPDSPGGTVEVPVVVSLEQYGGGPLAPAGVPVVVALDLVDAPLVVERPVAAAAAPVPEPAVLPPVVRIRDRVPPALWGLVAALAATVGALAALLLRRRARDRRRVPPGRRRRTAGRPGDGPLGSRT